MFHTQFGTIKDLRMATNEKGECRGFAFVDFEVEVLLILSLRKTGILMMVIREVHRRR